ncbi:hypothetical protein [Corynebacterium sputi]|uniref:hypothetical protein n=1 Tax=Corynebacterium sputi TaxID=489915 RepID=UPI00040D90A3|nr:hypothetical protein [Corynebacterium sputi]
MEILVLVLAALLVAVGIALFVVDARRRSASARPNASKGAVQAPEKVPAAAVPAAVGAEEPAPAEEPADEPSQVSAEELLWSAENDHDPQSEVDGEGEETEISVEDATTEHTSSAAPVPGFADPLAGTEPEAPGATLTQSVVDRPAEDKPDIAPESQPEPTHEEPIAAFAAPSIDDGLVGAAAHSDVVEDSDDTDDARGTADTADVLDESGAETKDEILEDVAGDVAEEDPDGRGGMPSEDLYAGLDDVPFSAPTPDTADLNAEPTPAAAEPDPAQVPAAIAVDHSREPQETETESPAPLAATVDRQSSTKSRFSGLAGRMKPKVGGRRARRAWATALQAEFEKSDHDLSAELDRAWARGPKGAVQDVVSNIFIDGRRFLLTDIGETTVLALQAPLASDVVLEFARSVDVESPDLANVGVEDGFLVSSNQPEVIHRVFDDRAHYVLRMMAAKTERQWTEDGWVVAVLDQDSGPTDWDEALEPLADFADIARRLPPAEAPETDVDMSDWDPSRPSTAPAAVKNVENTSGRRPVAEKYAREPERKIGGHLSAVPHKDDRPVFTGAIPIIDEEDPVWRPAPEMPAGEPYDLPSRSVSSRFGDLEFRDLGTAEDGEKHSSLPALGEDPEHIRARRTAGRVVREDTGPSGIFSDGSPSDEWGIVHEDETSGDNDRDTN